MKKAVTGLLLLACSSALNAAPQQVVPESVQIEDADTLVVEVAGVSYRIQLPDIDAPENTMNQKLQRDIERTGLGAEALLALGGGRTRACAVCCATSRPTSCISIPTAVTGMVACRENW
ncbi:MAG: hypothetical protein H6962_08775 [Chromatiaceae bacterium]|nr:hypothetical protein [Chromatiaceae bacterium]